MADIEKGYFPDKATQMEIKRGVDDVNVKQEQLKQSVNNISTQINNKSVGKVLKSKVFTSNGTFTAPAGVTEVYVTGGGAGGSGGAWGNLLTTSGNAGGVTSFGNLLSLPGGSGGAARPEGGIGSIVSLPGGPGGTAGKSNTENCNGGSSGYYAGGTGINQVLSDSGRAGDGAYCAGGGGIVNGHGGGGGHFVIDLNLAVTPGTQYVITIGRGGAGVQGRHSSQTSSTYTSGKGGDGILTVKWWE
ncbi:hypothetical protein [Lysinibacillus sphaericus]|uniref:Uncharacterized protein n=1 Tax=Lysinibacillus sphaericus OT4b.31 TaxID=1285586 RepID=R7Z8H8_LYSSH|nr:hypothetical protein [Lysinibacillus sphaericus]EON70447.1 hypothetical protein H131_21222 [Lysinibacillus sphaericus OT4b.31]